jgi:predicted small secreted protein
LPKKAEIWLLHGGSAAAVPMLDIGSVSLLVPGATDGCVVQGWHVPDAPPPRPQAKKGNLCNDTHVLQWSLSRRQEGTQMTKVGSRMGTDRSDLGWLFALTALFFMTLVLSGCNTARGMGEDVSAAGGAMSDTAEDTEEEIENNM